MMIKEVAEEIGVHPPPSAVPLPTSTPTHPKAFSNCDTFSPRPFKVPGAATPLLILKRKVKKMIEEEDSKHPFTDEQITARLRQEGVQVTRRTVAKYREDMKIASTHHRRVRD